jgi:Ca-activated chloride channel family protein
MKAAGIISTVLWMVLSGCICAAQDPAIPTTLPGRLIKLNLLVTDHADQAVDDVSKDDVQVLENDKPQTIASFEKDNRPVSYVLAIDTSGSFRSILPRILTDSERLVSKNRELDETMLIRFISSNKIEKVREFTRNETEILQDFKLLRIEDGQSAVIDAIYLSVQTAAARKAGDPLIHRAVVVISDGEDRASYYKKEDLIKLLRASDVQVFIIGVVEQLDDSRGGYMRPSPRQAAVDLLAKIADESGGRLFIPHTTDQFATAIDEIERDLHMQYLVGYETHDLSDEGFRKIRVKIDNSPNQKKRFAIARPGYFINPPDLEGKKKKKS